MLPASLVLSVEYVEIALLGHDASQTWIEPEDCRSRWHHPLARKMRKNERMIRERDLIPYDRIML